MADRYEYIVNRSRDFITLINREYTYEIVNDTYCQIIGRTREEVLNHTVDQIWGTERFVDSIKQHLDRCFGGQDVHYVERFKFGLEQRYMHVSYYPYREIDGGPITHALVFSHDITRLGEIETRLINYEYRDPLTGLFNRRSLEIILDMELQKAKRSGSDRRRALLFIGIDNLTEINRRFGYSIGSVILENTGLRTREELRASDFVFRFEGSDLVALLSSVTRATDVAKVAEKLVESISTPYRFRENDITVKCRIGASIFPEDSSCRDELESHAISALEEAARKGEPYVLFDAELHERAVRRLRTEGELQRAFEANQFVLYYQPIVDAGGTVEGAEALIRWDAPGRGILPPAEFIPLATETGAIEPIGRWALFTAVRQLAAWAFAPNVYVSINLTARELENPDLPEVIAGALAQHSEVSPKRLKLEITESELMAHPHDAIDRIVAIHELGVEVLIDDFGTGQSSLSYLKRLPVDALKIDRVFVEDLLNTVEDARFLNRIIDLVKSRGKRVIVEGVSAPEQLETLRMMDCDAFQGYLFAHPLPAADFEAVLRNGL